MKIWKRLAALLLCASLLVGLPISIQATEHFAADEFKIVKIEEMSDSFTGISGTKMGRTILLYFNNTPSAEMLENLNDKTIKFRVKTSGVTSITSNFNGTGTYVGGTNPIAITFGNDTADYTVVNASNFDVWRKRGTDVSFSVVMYDTQDADRDNYLAGATDVNGNKLVGRTGTYDGGDAITASVTDLTFKIERIMRMPDWMAKAESDKDRIVLVYFNQKIDKADNLKARVAGYKTSSTAAVDNCGATVVPEYKTDNCIGVRIDNTARSINGYFFGQKQVNYLRVALYEEASSGYPNDNKLNGLTCVDGIALGEATNTSYGQDSIWFGSQELYQNAVTIDSATKTTDTELLVKFSHRLTGFDYFTDGKKGYEPFDVLLRIVDENNTVYRSNTGEYDGSVGKTGVWYQWAPAGIETLDDEGTVKLTFSQGLKKAYTSMESLKRLNPDKKFFVKFCIEEKAISAGGPIERQKNGFIDGLTAADGSLLMATQGPTDAACIEVKSTVQLTGASLLADNHVLLTFSEAIAFPANVSIRVGLYNKSDNQLDKAYDAEPIAFYGSGDKLMTRISSVSDSWQQDIAAQLEDKYLGVEIVSAISDNDGMVNEISTTNGLTFLVATHAAEYDKAYVDLVQVQDTVLVVDEVRVHKDKSLLIDFSEDISYTTTQIYIVGRNDEGKLLWYKGNDKVYSNSKPGDGWSLARWNLAGINTYGNRSDMLVGHLSTLYSEIAAFVTGGRLELRMEEPTLNGNGLVDSITAGDKALLATKDGTAYFALTEYDYVTVTKAELVDNHTVKVKFNQAVTNTVFDSNNTGDVLFRLASVQDGYYTFAGKLKNAWAQWGNTKDFKPIDAEGNILPTGAASDTWSYTTTANLQDLYDMTQDPDSIYYGKYVLTLAFEDKVVTGGNMVGRVDNWTDAEGKYLLITNGDNGPAGGKEGFYAPITGMARGAVKVESMTILDEQTMQITFNKEISSYEKTGFAIRIVANNLANNQLVYCTGTGNNISNVSTAGGANRNALNFNLVPSTTDNKTFNLVFETSKSGFYIRNFSQFFRLAERSEFAGYTMVLAIMQNDGSGSSDKIKDGLVNTVVAVDGSKLLSSNLQYSDIYYKELPSAAVEADLLTIESVKQIGSSKLTVTFNRPIELVDMNGSAKPIVGLRMISPSGDVLRVDSVANSLITTGSNYLLWQAQEVWVDSTDGRVMIVDFGTTDIGVLISKINMIPALQGMNMVFTFEEENPGATEKGDAYYAGNHLIHHIRDAVTGKQADMTRFMSHSGDHLYVDIDEYQDPDPSAEVLIEKAEIISQSQVVVTFSEEVVIGGYIADPGTLPRGWIRLVNDNYGYKKTEDGAYYQWQGYFNYYNDAHTQLVFTLNHNGNPDLPMLGLDDIVTLLDDEYNRLVVAVDDRTGSDGVVDAVGTTTGHRLLADPFNGKKDIAYAPDLDPAQIPQGELVIVKAEAITDMEVVITFSAPVDITVNPYLAVRMLDENNKLLYKTADGMYVTASVTDGQKNTPMQWGMNWEWYNEAHTQIKCKIVITPGMCGNLTDVFHHDWNKEYEGCQIVVGMEENNEAIIRRSGYVDNVTLKGKPGVALTGNVLVTDRAGAFVPMALGYTPQKITAGARIINDTQIRIDFSSRVNIVGDPYMAIRLVDKDNDLLYSGDEYNHLPIQWPGSWTWTDESHTSIIWTQTGNAFGACNISDIVNYRGALKHPEGSILKFCIEDKTTADVIKVSANGVIDNVIGADGKNHLAANYMKTTVDDLYMDLNASILKDTPIVQLLSAKAIDDQTIELVFSESVRIDEGVGAPTMSIRYLTESGNTESLANGKTANFKGTWKYKDENKNVILWTLDSANAKSLTDIFNYEGSLKWNLGARVAFVISNDTEGFAAPARSMRLAGITDLSGVRKLSCDYASGQIMLDVEVAYDLPQRNTDADANLQEKIEYVTNYTYYIILSVAIVAVAVVIALLIKSKKKEEKRP